MSNIEISVDLPGEAQDRSDDELKKIAIDIVEGRIFTTNHLNENELDLIPIIFMPIGLGGGEILKQLHDNQVAVIFEYLDKAGPRAINGFPTFFTMQTIKSSETNRLADFIEKYYEMKAAFAKA